MHGTETLGSLILLVRIQIVGYPIIKSAVTWEAKVLWTTLQEIEAIKAKNKINDYLSGGSRANLFCRGIVAGLLLIIWVVLLWRGIWD